MKGLGPLDMAAVPLCVPQLPHTVCLTSPPSAWALSSRLPISTRARPSEATGCGCRERRFWMGDHLRESHGAPWPLSSSTEQAPTDQWPRLIHRSYFDCFETGSPRVTQINPELASPPVVASQVLRLNSTTIPGCSLMQVSLFQCT